jgi:alpha/beta superfamily hydrolase
MAPLREIQGPAGRIEVLLDQPSVSRGVAGDGRLQTGANGQVRAAVVFNHPHPQFGGTMHTKTVYHSAKALARIGCAVLRFNCRGVGRSEGRYDGGEGERDDFRAALHFMHDRYPEAPLWAAGMSFGSWIALTAGAEDPRVRLLLGVSTPVSTYDFSAVESSRTPKFLIHGEFDTVCPVRDVRAFYARAAEPKELVVIDSADHLFDGKTGEVADAIDDLLGDWPS